MHAAKAAAIGQALGQGKAVVVEIVEAGGSRCCRCRRRRLLWAAAIAIWQERQLPVEILLMLLLQLQLLLLQLLCLEWIHQVAAAVDEQRLLALEGIDMVVIVVVAAAVAVDCDGIQKER